VDVALEILAYLIMAHRTGLITNLHRIRRRLSRYHGRGKTKVNQGIPEKQNK
jgi:hypothetical protein